MFPLSAIPDRRPFAPSALPEFIARMGASDFRSPPPSSSLFRLVRRRALLPAPTIGSPWLPRTLVVRLDADSDPGVAPRACQFARDAVVCWPIETIDQFTNLTISGLEYLQGQHHLFPLHLASFCAYASSTPLPEHLQGSIPGPWLAVTWAGFAPARLRGIAKPQPLLAPHWVLAGHPPDQCTQLSGNLWSARSTLPSPKQAPAGTLPPDHCLRLYYKERIPPFE
jgi:hypothetical protein